MRKQAKQTPRDAAMLRLWTIGMAKAGPRQRHVSVAALRVYLEAKDRELNPAEILVKILGSEETALQWMRETIATLEARIASRALPSPKGAP